MLTQTGECSSHSKQKFNSSNDTATVFNPVVTDTLSAAGGAPGACRCDDDKRCDPPPLAFIRKRYSIRKGNDFTIGRIYNGTGNYINQWEKLSQRKLEKI